MVTLATIPVPGYAEAVRKEQASRVLAYLQPYEVVCGIEVRPISLRLVLTLEVAQNGFVVPCVFDNDAEATAHAMQALYFAHRGFDARREATILGKFAESIRREYFIRRVMRLNRGKLAVAKAVREWFAEAFMDAPQGGGDSIGRPSLAAYPAYIGDLFAEAGIPMGHDELLDTPLRILWQRWRVAMKRINPKAGITNASDALAVAAAQGIK